MSLCWGGSQVSNQWLNMPLQGQHLWQEVLSLSVEEYNRSKIQSAISNAVKAAFHDHKGDMDGLCDAIIKIVTEHACNVSELMVNTPTSFEVVMCLETNSSGPVQSLDVSPSEYGYKKTGVDGDDLPI
ncbi:hypothetical protein BKA82DRAFT_4021830 [Pisolithus tinctorius]|nr:hypothetical protein BKA82DRAFT_4021830 [Pisolithus tinctorius]